MHNGPQAVPDPAATAAAKKAGLVNIALTVVCQMKPDLDVRDGVLVFKKACGIVSDLLDEYPGVKDSTLVINAAPPQQ